MNRVLTIAATTALLIATPSMALAHLVNSGLGPFYDGVMHLLLSPGDLIGLLAALFLAGLHGKRAGRLTVIALPAAWLAAGASAKSNPATAANIINFFISSSSIYGLSGAPNNLHF